MVYKILYFKDFCERYHATGPCCLLIYLESSKRTIDAIFETIETSGVMFFIDVLKIQYFTSYKDQLWDFVKIESVKVFNENKIEILSKNQIYSLYYVIN